MGLLPSASSARLPHMRRNPPESESEKAMTRPTPKSIPTVPRAKWHRPTDRWQWRGMKATWASPTRPEWITEENIHGRWVSFYNVLSPGTHPRRRVLKRMAGDRRRSTLRKIAISARGKGRGR